MRVNSGLQTLLEQEKQTSAQPASGFAAMLRAAATKAQASTGTEGAQPVSGPEPPVSAEDINVSQETREEWESYGQGFGVFMISQLLWGVDISRPINVASTGDQALSEEQIAELREKYDVKNLTAQERYDLLCDLSDMNAVSVEDLCHLVLRKPILQGGFLIPVGSDEFNPYEHRIETNLADANFFAYLLNTVTNNNMEYGYMMDIGKNPKAGEGQVEGYKKFMAGRDYIDTMMGSHQKMYDLLSQLVR